MVFACSRSPYCGDGRYWLPFMLTRKEKGGLSRVYRVCSPLGGCLQLPAQYGRESLGATCGSACWELRSASGPGRCLGVLRRLGVSWTRSAAALVPHISLAYSPSCKKKAHSARGRTRRRIAVALIGVFELQSLLASAAPRPGQKNPQTARSAAA